MNNAWLRIWLTTVRSPMRTSRWPDTQLSLLGGSRVLHNRSCWSYPIQPIHSPRFEKKRPTFLHVGLFHIRNPLSVGSFLCGPCFDRIPHFLILSSDLLCNLIYLCSRSVCVCIYIYAHTHIRTSKYTYMHTHTHLVGVHNWY